MHQSSHCFFRVHEESIWPILHKQELGKIQTLKCLITNLLLHSKIPNVNLYLQSSRFKNENSSYESWYESFNFHLIVQKRNSKASMQCKMWNFDQKCLNSNNTLKILIDSVKIWLDVEKWTTIKCETKTHVKIPQEIYILE